jgi:TolB-like protein/ketosteroid isomerase-like protein
MTAGKVAVVGGCITVTFLVAWGISSFERAPEPLAGTGGSVHPVAETSAGTPLLWVLAIGVSRYQQPDLRLQFADADARAIAAALESQGDGPLYRGAKTLVLTDAEVTRESVLGSMERFQSQAGPDDVAVIFVAGHGVQDLATGSYYFLPYPASAGNVLTAGLRMSDFDEMVRALRRTVRAVVLMLDTCHAGALHLASSGLAPADDSTARLSAGDGFFLLAATKPGQESKEKPELGHGAFTYALLEGLRGEADVGRDGVLTVSDLFAYVAREVPRLTGGLQQPYHKVEGTDLAFVAVRPDGHRGAPLPNSEAISQAAPRSAPTPVPNTIGVMEFHNLRADAEHDWVGRALRVAFNTELSKVRALHVYAPELIDRAAKARGTDQLYVAQQLGIDRLVTGSFNVVGGAIRIDARIVDAASGLQEGSDSVQGDLVEFFDLQKKLVLSILRRLRVRLTAEEGTSIQRETNTDVDAYRLLLETEGVVEESHPSTRPAPTPRATGTVEEPRSRLDAGLQSIAALLWAPAYAAEPDTDAEAGVRRAIEEYRLALESKDLDNLAALYASFAPRQREALHAYLDNAGDLHVEFVDVAVVPHGDGLAVTYTRRDRFVDRESGKTVRLEVRLTKIFMRENGKWKIAAGQ